MYMYVWYETFWIWQLTDSKEDDIQSQKKDSHDRGGSCAGTEPTSPWYLGDWHLEHAHVVWHHRVLIQLHMVGGKYENTDHDATDWNIKGVACNNAMKWINDEMMRALAFQRTEDNKHAVWSEVHWQIVIKWLLK